MQAVVQSADAALVFDLGVVGNPTIVRNTTLFNEFLPARESSSLHDYLRAGMAPPLEGIYDRTLVPDGVAPVLRDSTVLASRREVRLRDLRDGDVAVFISHLHDDHMKLIPYLDAAVPILMSDDSARMHRALVAAKIVPPIQATPVAVPYSDMYQVSDLQVRVLPVDHDIPGSSGVLIEGPQGARIAYTGDWRAHGRWPEKMDEFAQACSGVDILLTEASTIDHRPESLAAQVAERDVAPRFAEIIDSAHGSVYISFYQRNIERHADFLTVIRDRGRQLLVTAQTARLWRNWQLESLGDGNVFAWSHQNTGEPTGDLPTATAKDVATDPSRWVCELPTRHLPLLLDTRAGRSDTFVLSNGHPYSSDAPYWTVLQTWIRELGLRWEQISSHGHAFPSALTALVTKIRPGLVIPVHTNEPDAFPNVPAEVHLAYEGEELWVSS